MVKKYLSWSLIILLFSFRMAVAAPGQSTLVFAAVTGERFSLNDFKFRGGILQVFGLNTQPQTITTPEAQMIKSIVWSPDKTALVFIAQDETSRVNTLMAADPNTGEAYPLVNTPVYDAIHFMTDGTVLYRAEDTFYSIAPKRNAQPEVVTQVASCTGGGGSGGSFILSYEYYQRETGAEGQTPLLAITANGLLTAFPCYATRYNLYDSQTGDLKATFPATFRRMALSQDGGRLAVVNTHAVFKQPYMSADNELALIDLTDPFAPTTLYTEGYPDQVAWSSDEQHLYYSTTSRLPLNSSSDTSSGISIHDLDLHSGNERVLYQSDDGYAIARMQAQGDWLVFSIVSDQLDGYITSKDGGMDADPALEKVKPISVYALSLTSGEMRVLAEDAARFALRP